MKDKDIDTSDVPELDADFWDNAELIMPQPKASLTLRLDQDVVDYFRAGGRGYQTRMNAALRSFMVNHRRSSAAKRR